MTLGRAGKLHHAANMGQKLTTSASNIRTSIGNTVETAKLAGNKRIAQLKSFASSRVTSTGRVLEEGLIETGRVIDKGVTSVRQAGSDLLNPQMATPDGSIFRKSVENNHAVENMMRSQMDDVKGLFGKGNSKGTGSTVKDDIIRDGSHISKDGKLTPNIKYQTGEYSYHYKSDDFGRITEFDAEDLQLTTRENRLPHKSNTPGKEPGDHAGHLAADRFGGSPEFDNLVSQSSSVNLSKYKKLENQWAKAIENGKKVTVNVKVIYEGNGLRPSSFEVKYSIDGNVKKRVFNN